MGWFGFGSSSSSTDPLRDLDPSLREFLTKESPVKYNPAPAPSPEPKPKPTPTPSTSEPPSAEKPLVPPQSLYPDGRYAHLWRNYRPLADIENESKSEQEKLADVFEGYKARKAQIGRAAVENCVFEQLEMTDCFQNGGVKSKMTMCSKESREFERCYLMQSRFLKALGYLSTYERPPDVEEQLQMHADTLYHRMLAQEKAMERAKAAGRPEPAFAPILGSETAFTGPPTAHTPDETLPSTFATAATNPTITATEKDTLPPLSPTTQSLLNPASQQKLRERMKDMPPHERELEERSVQMEARTASDIVGRFKEVEEGRRKRRDAGVGSAADTVAGWFGW